MHVPNLKFLASPVPKIQHVPLNGWMREGCAQTRAWISVVFTRPPPNLIWHQHSRMVNALRSCFIFPICLRIELRRIVSDLAWKMVQILGFSAPFVLGDTLKKSVSQRFCWILSLSHVVWESFGMSVFWRLRKYGERKKNLKKYP